MKILLIYLLLVIQVFASEKQNCFEWEGSSDTLSKDGKPYSTLWIYYCTTDNKIEGSYSFITLYGNRIDGEYDKNAKTLNGTIDGNIINIKFYNGFDNKWNNAVLKLINHTNSLWTVLDKTSWDTVKNYKLNLVQNKKDNKTVIPDKLLIEVDKAYLYNDDNEDSKTNIFLLNYDTVQLNEQNFDLISKWYQVIYNNKIYWIKSEDCKVLYKKQEINESKSSKNTPTETEKSFFSKLLEWFGISQYNNNIEKRA
jgi:hypothetical protein